MPSSSLLSRGVMRWPASWTSSCDGSPAASSLIDGDVGDGADAQHLHAGVMRDQGFGHGAHAHGIGADGAQKAHFGGVSKLGPERMM